MQKNIYMMHMFMKKMNRLILIILCTVLASCSLAPGMHMVTKSQGNEKYVYIDSIDKNLFIENISENLSFQINKDPYRIGNGDQISITVWGLPEIFPVVNINPDQNLRRVDSNGNIYFPFVGIIKASGRTQNELRIHLTKELSNFFTDPQLDVSIARFNSQNVYLLGEVTKPIKLNITDIPLSLSEALGSAFGLNTNTASGSEVYIIRQNQNQEPKIFLADLSTPTGFIDAGNFYLDDNDIIYVNARGTTRWNRVISQFFPFSTFLNSIDNLTSD